MIRTAWLLAFLMAAGTAITAMTDTIVLLPFALIPLAAGIGILLRRVWSAYGFAIYCIAQLLIIPVLMLRNSNPHEKLTIVGATVMSAAVAAVFFRAGRQLAASGAKRGWALPWLVLSVGLVLTLIVFGMFAVPTDAMADTLLSGDRIAVRRFPRGTPKRGDIFALVYPVDRRQTFIKRIVGLPGDHIRISHKQLIVNGTRVNEPFVTHKLDYEDLYRDNFPSEPNAPVFPQALDMLANHVVNGEVVVPAGEYFVLGDNRDQSLDSRYWGFVRDSDLIGKAVLIYDSVSVARQRRRNRVFKLL